MKRTPYQVHFSGGSSRTVHAQDVLDAIVKAQRWRTKHNLTDHPLYRITEAQYAGTEPRKEEGK